MPFIIRFAFRFNILDIPDNRKIHSTPIPKIGGIAVACGFIPSILLTGTQSPELIAIIAASLLVFVSGVLDDMFSISAKLRLFVQSIAAFLVVLFGVHLNILSADTYTGTVINVLLTFLWIIGITNAFNFLDGINGEASGLAVIIGLTLAVFAFNSGAALKGAVIVIAIGAVCGFLPYNLKRNADIFLGDGGSGFLGFFLSAMSIHIEWGEQPSLTNLLMPVIVFSICIYDMCMTTATRIYTGKVKTFLEWLIYTGKDHIHHRLSDIFRGNKLTAVGFIYAISASNAIFPALFAIYKDTSNWFIIAAFFQTILTYVIVTILLFRSEHSWHTITKDLF
ncbi:MAG: undecaprenyl/decaprenyl-phosphate alpha-N-acetylglucosaminyl 1-phosphate transferase [Deltaproteobacteria bacterium]|nr:undecaprenyl/decaprenyl-phosphate alpha-N-acetylglucosaminyl 1-phosphate transferase [Deltaproteobacteria bacterium]